MNAHYRRVHPLMESVGKIISEPFAVLSAGDRKEILTGTGRYSSVDICVSMQEKSSYWLEDGHKRKISSGSCMKAQDILPVSFVVGKRPDIGSNYVNVTFVVKMN
ncbi:hypothetical protein ROB41_004935 [Escherichia coli]|nr:hypothetical protein [Escherichia coli]